MEFASPPPPPPSLEPGGPPSPGRPPLRQRIPHAALVGGLVFGMALGGAGIAFAAGSGSGTGSSTTTPTSGNQSPAAPGPDGHDGHDGRMGRMGPMGLGGLGLRGGKVLYGSATIQTPSGATKTIDFQVGTVTATNISGDSGTITVGSGTNNSHTQTYTVQPSTIVDSQAGGIATVKTGDKVVVIAQDNGGGNPTAMDIRDRTQMKNSREGFGFGEPANPNGQNGSTTNPPASTSGFLGEVN